MSEERQPTNNGEEPTSDRDKKEKDAQPCVHCIEYRAGWQRAQADYLNLKREIEAKRSDWVKMSEVQILEDFIPIFDNFKKAFAVDVNGLTKEQQNWKQGIEFIMKQFEKVLVDHGIVEISTVGEPFDPLRHEAVAEEASDEYEEGVVIKELESGYAMGELVIKVAKVVVAKKTS